MQRNRIKKYSIADVNIVDKTPSQYRNEAT